MSPDEMRVYRAKHRLTQAQFAKLAGVSRQTVYNWERGTSKPPYDVGATVGAALLARGATLLDAKQAEREAEKIARQQLDNYNANRANGNTHAMIVELYQRTGHVVTPRAQQLIIEAWPDILAPANPQPNQEA